MRQIRAAAVVALPRRPTQGSLSCLPAATSAPEAGPAVAAALGRTGQSRNGSALRQEALDWAMANRGPDGRLPSGKAIAGQFDRHERWGRMVKQHASDAGTVRQRAAA
jgi:hypothetical protein